MSDKQQEPMYIDFPDNEAAEDAMTSLYSNRKVDLTHLSVNADLIADYAERRRMTGMEKFEYLTKFSL